MRTASERKAEAARYQQLTEQATAKSKSALLNKAAELMEQADALVQEALGASDECFSIHMQIENTRDDIVDNIVEIDGTISA